MSKYTPFIAGFSIILFIALISYSLLSSNKPVKPASLAYTEAEVDMAVEKKLKTKIYNEGLVEALRSEQFMDYENLCVK